MIRRFVERVAARFGWYWYGTYAGGEWRRTPTRAQPDEFAGIYLEQPRSAP